jgi:hypothetical protein
LFDDSVPTGDYYGYAAQIANGIYDTDGSEAGVEALTASVLANAGLLSDPDLYVLAGTANLADSSAAYWESEDTAGNLPPAEIIYPMSLFAPRRSLWALIGIVGADVIGCLTGEVSEWGTTQARMYSACRTWGGGASAGALWAVLTSGTVVRPVTPAPQ